MPVYVSGSRDTPFDNSFRELLRTRLVDNSVPVAPALIAGGLELRFDALVISQQNEVLINTALQNNDLFLSRTSNAYRISPAEQSSLVEQPRSSSQTRVILLQRSPWGQSAVLPEGQSETAARA